MTAEQTVWWMIGIIGAADVIWLIWAVRKDKQRRR